MGSEDKVEPSDMLSNNSGRSIVSGKRSTKSKHSVSRKNMIPPKYKAARSDTSNSLKQGTPKNLAGGRSGFSEYGSQKNGAMGSRDKMASYKKGVKTGMIKTPRNDPFRNITSEKGKSPIARFNITRNSAIGGMSSGSRSYQVGDLNPTPQKQDLANSLQRPQVTPHSKFGGSMKKGLLSTNRSMVDGNGSSQKHLLSHQPLALVDEKPSQTKNLYE